MSRIDFRSTLGFHLRRNHGVIETVRAMLLLDLDLSLDLFLDLSHRSRPV